jgi:hypothetical protein
MDTQDDTGSGSPADAGGVIVRDDQSDFPSLLDAVKASRGAGGRFKLIDSGKLSLSELEWLGEAGADFYTSDRARPDGRDLILMNAAARRGSAVTAYFHHGPFEPEEKEKSVSFATFKELGRSGLYIYTSNGRIPRDFASLEELSFACVRGRFALYHHGPLAPALETLARQGAWIHIADQSLHREDDAIFLCDCAGAARERGGGVLFHVEHPLDLAWLERIFDAGARVIFHTPPSDYRSPQRPFESRAERLSIDSRAFYIYPRFML